jgi:flagellar biosynthesis protein FlhF
MRLKTYHAGSIVQAMAMIRAELGQDALILSSRRVAGGVEVVACLEPAEEALNAPPPRAPAPPQRWAPPPYRPPRVTGSGTLAWHGVPASLADRLQGRDLADGLAQALQFGALPLQAPAPLLFVGAPGAGKTLTVARLATRLVLAGQMPLVISADGRRAGAAEELAAYTRLLGAELIVASKPATVTRALTRRPAGAPVLIDAPGLNPFDPAQIGAMRGLAESAAAVTVLVLQAGQDTQEAVEQAEIFAAAGVGHLIPTRLDIARRLGAILGAAFAGGLRLSEAGTGPGATDGLTPLTAGLLADWLGRARAPFHPTPQAQTGHIHER